MRLVQPTSSDFACGWGKYPAGTNSNLEFIRNMKSKRKTTYTFGDFVSAAYQVWGSSKAGRMVRKAIDSRQLVFLKHGSMWSAKMKGV